MISALDFEKRKSMLQCFATPASSGTTRRVSQGPWRAPILVIATVLFVPSIHLGCTPAVYAQEVLSPSPADVPPKPNAIVARSPLIGPNSGVLDVRERERLLLERIEKLEE